MSERPELPASSARPRPPSPPALIPALTGLRGIAAWWVVFYHFRELFAARLSPALREFVGSGYLAVDLFFVLSGFVIALNYVEMLSPFSFGRYWRFLGLRLARIYPLHGFMLLCFLANPLAVSLAATQGMDWERYSPAYWVASVFLVQNWWTFPFLAWNVPAWSISTEWMAYLCFPLIAWLFARTARSLVATLAGLAAPLVILGVSLDWMGQTLGGGITQNGLIRCVLEFTCGVFVYQFWLRARFWSWSQGVALAGFGAAVAVRCLSDLNEVWSMPLACACLVFVMACGGRWLDALLANRPMALLGAWSYSTYLVHYFVRDWAKFVLVGRPLPWWVILGLYAGLTLAASAVLFRTVEVPGRRMFRARIGRVASAAG